jgi:FkbM family methyltransferase
VADRADIARAGRAPGWVIAAAFVIAHLPFGRYRLLSYLRRFATPPFLMRFPADLGGGLFHCDLRDATAAEVCFTGRYEPQETQLLQDLLRPGDVFVDVGANWGYYTLAAAHLIGSAGRVVAFEPEPRLFALLSSNIAINALGQVVQRPVAVGASVERMPFSAFKADDGNWGVSRAVGHDRAMTVDFETDSVPLDAALDAASVDVVQLVKIDVEGAETGVLAGMERGLSGGRYRYVLLECHPGLLAERGASEMDCATSLAAAGYRLWLIAQSPSMHRRAARRRVPQSELLRPYRAGEPMGGWPHLLAAAPGAAAPCL